MSGTRRSLDSIRERCADLDWRGQFINNAKEVERIARALLKRYNGADERNLECLARMSDPSPEPTETLLTLARLKPDGSPSVDPEVLARLARADV